MSDSGQPVGRGVVLHRSLAINLFHHAGDGAAGAQLDPTGNVVRTLNLNGGTMDVLASTDNFFDGAKFNTIPLNGDGLKGAPALTLNVGKDITVTMANSFTDQSGNGPASLAKTGEGTLILTGNNTYTGDTIVKAGTLKLSGNGSLSSSPSKIVIGSDSSATLDVRDVGGFRVLTGQTFGGNSTIYGSMTFENGSILAPGNSIGTVIVTGEVGDSVSLTLADGCILDFDFGKPGSESLPGNSDRVVVNGALILPEDGRITLNLSDNANADGWGSIGNGTYMLFLYDSLDSVRDDLNTVFFVDSTPFCSADYTFFSRDGAIYLNIEGGTLVPEPASLAILMLGGLALLRRRQ